MSLCGVFVAELDQRNAIIVVIIIVAAAVIIVFCQSLLTAVKAHREPVPG